MRTYWIILIIFAFAQGNYSLPVEHHTGEDVLPGFKYPKRQPSTLDRTQEPSSNDARSHENHGKMSDESHGLISGRLDKLFKRYNLGKGMSKKVMRLLKSRLQNLATDIGKILRDSNHALDKGSGLHLEVPTKQYPRKLTNTLTTNMEKVSVEPSIRESVQGINTSPDTTLDDEVNEMASGGKELLPSHPTAIERATVALPEDIKNASGKPDSEWNGNEIEPEKVTSGDDMDEPEPFGTVQLDSRRNEDMEEYIESDESDNNEGVSGDSPDNPNQPDGDWRKDVEEYLEPHDLTAFGNEDESHESPNGDEVESNQLSDGPDEPDVENEESHFSRKKRAAPEHGHKSYKNAKRNIELDTKRQFPMPSSGIRWRGVSMAHHRSQDGGANVKKSKRAKEEDGGDTGLSTLHIVVFALGASLVVLLMMTFFIYSWPVRRYYAKMCQRIDQEDVESGWYNGELSSIQIEPSDPGYLAMVSAPVSPLPPPKKATKSSAVSKRLAKVGKAAKRNRQTTQARSILDKTGGRSLHEVLCEDRKRDFRNVERRKTIQMLTSQRRDSLVSSLLAAKAIIDGHAKNKEFEEKAYERRHKIKQFNSIPGAPHDSSKRRRSFVEEIQNACSVITPHWADDIKLQQSKEKCRRIKNQIGGKRRPSLLDEIQVAKSVIMERKKYSMCTALVEEMISVGLDPNDYCSYYVMDYCKGPSKAGTCVLEMEDTFQ